MIAPRPWLLAAIPLLACCAVVLDPPVAGAAATPGPCAAATYAHHVSVVVEHGDGRTVRACAGFDGPAIGAEAALRASAIEYATAGYGGALGDAVCQIDGEPATYPSTCWTTTSPYWVFFVARSGGPWVSSAAGISSTSLAAGDAEGFRYDPQSSGPARPPGAVASGGATPATATDAPIAVAQPAGAPHPAGVDLTLLVAAAAAACLAALVAVQSRRRRGRGAR